jgi:ribonuclease HI
MKKSLMKKHLKEIERVLRTREASVLVSALLDQVEGFDEVIVKQSANDSLEVPEFVRKNSLSFALYTDGACRGNPGPGSYAYLVQEHSNKIVHESARHSEYTTNNKMEMSAVVEGLEFLKESVSPMHTIYVFTDSKYVVDGMKSWIHSWKKRGWKKADKKPPENLDLWKSLDQLSQICKVEFHWVKGHSGHPQNEYVDVLANKVLDENGF